jgi:hypothetical protein
VPAAVRAAGLRPGPPQSRRARGLKGEASGRRKEVGELQERIKELEARPTDHGWRDAYIEAEVELAAGRAGAKKPALVTKLIATDPLKSLDSIEQIKTGCEAAVAEVLADAPELKGIGDQLVTQGARLRSASQVRA